MKKEITLIFLGFLLAGLGLSLLELGVGFYFIVPNMLVGGGLVGLNLAKFF